MSGIFKADGGITMSYVCRRKPSNLSRNPNLISARKRHAKRKGVKQKVQMKVELKRLQTMALICTQRTSSRKLLS